MSDTTTYADLVFRGGPVLAIDPARSRARAVAVANGRIVAVGGDDDLDGLIGPTTDVVELQGRLLIPGFQDAHVHPVAAGLERLQCDLTGIRDAAATVAAIRSYADANPTAEWISGGGWSMEAFDGGTPTAELIDGVIPDRPMYLPNRDHHGAWVNSRALALAGIDRDTPDPTGGRIERDAAGNPTGMLQESAMDLVGVLVPKPTADDMVAALLLAQDHLHSLGITAWQDAIVGPGAPVPDCSEAYARTAADGRLTARVAAALWWDRTRGAEQIDDLVELRTRLGTDRLRASTVKLMLDGVAESQTAAMLEPYLDSCGCAGPYRGTTFIEPSDLAKYVALLDALDFQCHFHALGDRAVRHALDAIEVARASNGFRDTRPHLAHIQVVDPADLPRFRRLAATANMQPLWAAHEPQMDVLTIPFLGERRARHQYPFGDLLRTGVTLAAGSDWPVSSADPIEGIHVAVNRRLPGRGADDPVFLPEQRIDLMSAIAAYTAGSAYVNHFDDTGSIRVGNHADLVVLDRDPFDHAADEIADTHVDQTFVGGVSVYRA
jgi:predicted amidohydrolase YtcJ